MRIELNIDEEMLTQLVTEKLADDIRHEAFERGYGIRMWRDIAKETIREILKENKDEIVDYAVKYAGEYIGKKGVAKFVEGLKND